MIDQLLQALAGGAALLGSPVFALVGVSFLAFVTVLLLVVALGTPAEATLQRRLRVYGYDLTSHAVGDLEKPFTERVLAPVGRNVFGLVARLTPTSVVTASRQRLREAGSPMGLTTFLSLRILAGLLFPAIYLGPRLLSGIAPTIVELLFTLFLLYVGNRLPDIWLSFQIDGRRGDITSSLPDALDLIVVCVEAGYGLEAAISKVVEATKGPLSQEFDQMLAEISVGRPRREALRDLGVRCGSADLQTFIAAMLQADQMGVAIAEALRVQADAMRIRRRQRAEELIAKAPVKMLIPLTVFIFPALLVVIGGPAFLRIGALFSSLGR